MSGNREQCGHRSLSFTARGELELDVRTRLFAVAITALLPGIGLLTYNELSSRHARSAEVHLEAAHATQNAAAEMDRVLEGAKSLLIAVSALPTVVDLEPASCSASLRRIADSLEMTGAILVINAQQKLVCDSQGNPSGVDFSERTYVNDGLRASDDTLVVGTYTVSKLTGAAVLPVAVPLKRDGATIGVVATAIKLDWLQARMAERNLAGGGKVTMADRDGVVLAQAPSAATLAGTKLVAPLLAKVQASGPGILDLIGPDGSEDIVAYQPASLNMPVFVSTGISSSAAFQSINRTTWASVSMLILSIVAAFIAATYVGNRFILRPIHRIVDVLEAYKSGDTATRTQMRGTAAELGLVGDTVDSLLDELETRRDTAALAEQRRALLVGELRHRVKNTLAVVTAIARQTFPRDDRLESFSQRLSALGRAYDLIFAGEEGSPDALIADVVKTALAPYDESSGAPFIVAGNPLTIEPEAGLALSLVIHELATNAAKYGALSNDGGRIYIAWESTNGRLTFSWHEQNGPTVSKPDRAGFGSQLIRRAFPAVYDPELIIDYAPDGVKCTLAFNQGTPNAQLQSVREPMI